MCKNPRTNVLLNQDPDQDKIKLEMFATAEEFATAIEVSRQTQQKLTKVEETVKALGLTQEQIKALKKACLML